MERAQISNSIAREICEKVKLDFYMAFIILRNVKNYFANFQFSPCYHITESLVSIT